MSEREVCAACQGPWPCGCSEQAAPVVLMESADDKLAADLAHRMGAGRNDPLVVKPYDDDPPIKDTKWGNFDKYCGHGQYRYDLDSDKRIVSCRNCDTALDPYDVLGRLAGMLQIHGHQLNAMQELERREAVRDGERKARAAVRRHRYAPYAYKREPEHCGTCPKSRDNAIHTEATQ